MPRETQRRIEINGHAGAAGFFRFNTEHSILRAMEFDVDRIEIDVVATGDGTLVLHHDLDISFDGRVVPVADLSLAEIQQIDPEILTLDRAVGLTGFRIPLLVDIKGRGYEDLLADALRNILSKGPVYACSTHARSLRILRNAVPPLPTGLSRGHSLTRVPGNDRTREATGNLISVMQIPSLFSLADWCGANAVMIQHYICSAILVRLARQRGYHVNVWTVDRPVDIQRVIGRGVDSITSNRPDLVMAELKSRP